MKLVTIINSERCDFTYYLGRVLSSMSSSVIMIDNSETHELFDTVLNPLTEEDKEQEMVERGNVTYLKDVGFSPEFFPTFDYIVVHMGNSYDEEFIDNSNDIISMPDCRPSSLKSVPELPDRTEYILRDRAGKINEKSAAALLNVNIDQIAGAIEHDADDYAHYIAFLYNGKQKIRGVSDDMIQALAYVTAKITEQDEKAVLKALKKEKRSKA